MDEKIVTIHQPEHMPWLGYVNKMLKADVFVIMDNVQYEKNYFQNRNRILTKNGVQFLTVPVEMKGHTEKTIKDMVIANNVQPRWKEKYIRTLCDCYKKHPGYQDLFPKIEAIFNEPCTKICELNIKLIKLFADILSAKCCFVRASELDVTGKKSDLVLDMCKALDAAVYIAGPSGRDYMDMDSFANAGIKVSFNDFVHPTYPQLNSKEFVPYMSTLDLLMNVSPNEARDIILCGLPHVTTDTGEIFR